MARVVLLAGASGSGKTSLTRRVGIPVLALDNFYREGDDPELPRRFGIVDWDDPCSWNADAAFAAISQLCRTGRCEVPIYDIPTSRRTGELPLDLGGAGHFVAEGIFAAELVAECRAQGLLVDAICLSLHPAATFVRRLARDLAESRKPPHTLIRRGIGLARAEPALVKRWVGLGCRPVSMADAERTLRALP